MVPTGQAAHSGLDAALVSIYIVLSGRNIYKLFTKCDLAFCRHLSTSTAL